MLFVPTANLRETERKRKGKKGREISGTEFSPVAPTECAIFTSNRIIFVAINQGKIAFAIHFMRLIF